MPDDSWAFIKEARNTISELQHLHRLTYRNAVGGAIALHLQRRDGPLWKNPASPKHGRACIRETVAAWVRHLPLEMEAAGFLPINSPGVVGALITKWLATSEAADTIQKIFSCNAEDNVRYRHAVEKAMAHIAKKFPRRRFRQVDEGFIEELGSIFQTDKPKPGGGVGLIHRLRKDGSLDYNDFVIRNILERRLEEISETPGAIGEEGAALLEQTQRTLSYVEIALDALESMSGWAESEGTAAVALLDRERIKVHGMQKPMTDKALMKRFNLPQRELTALKDRFMAELRRRFDGRATA